MNEMQLTYIPLVDIEIDDEFNCRGELNHVDVSALAQDIAKNGLIQPVVVRPLLNGKFGLVAGFRRTKAHQILEKETIAAVVRDNLSETDAGIINLIENINRENLNLLQEAKAVVNLLRKDPLLGRNGLAEKLQKSPGWVQIRLMVADMPKEIQQELASGDYTQQEIRDLYSLKTPEERFAAIKLLKDNKSKGLSKPARLKSVNADSKHPRNRKEIFAMMDHIREVMDFGFWSRCLAWASGEITDTDLYETLEKEADEKGVPYAKPTVGVSMLG